MTQLEKSKRFYTGNREEYDKRLEDLRQQQAETQRKINALVDSLADFGDSTAAVHVRKRLEELHAQDAELQARITELEGLTAQHALSGIEFDLMRQLLTVFRDGIDEMTVEQKRAAIRTVVRKVIWDGQYAHVVLFGAVDEDVDWRDAADVLPALDIRNPDGNEEDTEDLEPFGDVDYEEEEPSHDIPAETPWGEDSK